ncbi:MAG: ArsR/SmtB family transcription factor [Planctomycetota bacterium]|jgi:ArsR family transcriptional regulator
MSLAEKPQILDHLAALSDATRCRLLLVLGRHELTVSELCRVLRLPQSTVSRHLRILADGGWVHSRPEGTHRLYSLLPDDLAPAARDLWGLARDQVSAAAGARDDARRLDSVLAERRSRSREFFASAAGRWDRMRDDLFGSRIYSLSLLGLLDPDWTVGDLGCGTGAVSEALAPFVGRVVAVDGSAEMLDAARERLSGHENVDLRSGELERLPIDDRSLDAATLILVLHHLPDPARVLTEVARKLRPGGRLLLVDMLPHDRQEYRQQMGHVWLGFSEEQIDRLLSTAGLSSRGFRSLPTDPSAGAPSLFAAVAGRSTTGSE